MHNMDKMKRLLLLFICFISIYANSQGTDERTGIQIFFKIDKEAFPKSWETEEISAKGTSLDKIEIDRSLKVIIKALSKYPIELVKENIAKIYILKSIEFYGQEFGATNSNDVIYIANNGELLGYSDFYIEKSFHHEFSSILLRNYPKLFNEEKWKRINKISYGNGGVQALKDSKDSQSFDSLLALNGFLFEYATSDLENDFNSFAENLFNPSDEFYLLVDKYVGIHQKYKLIIEFYSKLHKSLTEDFFRKIIK